MTKININHKSKQILYGIIAIILMFAYFPNIASASQITPRKVVLGSSIASASTTYAFTFTVPSTTVIQSVGIAACTTASGTCTPAPLFSSGSSSLTSQPTNLGDAAGWTVSDAVTTSLRLSKSGDVAAPTGSQTVSFSNVTNPSATNSTFFLRITTYSDAAWTTPIDTGVVAASTAGQVTVTASVDETLTFTLATATIPLGTLTTSTTGAGTSSMTVGTNAATGYSVGYSGATLTSAAGSITAMAAGGASTVGTASQFGINLMQNTTPTIGSNVSGTGTGAAQTGYSTANSFKFNPAGDIVAAATVPTNTNIFTTSYIANITANQPAGFYSTALTYTATGNF
ncbi:MAG TPA: hypothetical protein VMR16_03860 [Candidatus Saccharimonadales bacterium]|nr:hypothetical protein [Candidatus Saccharimonadales bacterium]